MSKFIIPVSVAHHARLIPLYSEALRLNVSNRGSAYKPRLLLLAVEAMCWFLDLPDPQIGKIKIPSLKFQDVCRACHLDFVELLQGVVGDPEIFLEMRLHLGFKQVQRTCEGHQLVIPGDVYAAF